MSILSMTADRRNAERAEAMIEYRKLLEHANPTAHHAKRLNELMGFLGKSNADVEKDIADLRHEAELIALVAKLPELEAVRSTALAAQKEFWERLADAVIAQLEDEQRRTTGAAVDADNAWITARKRIGTLPEFRASNAELMSAIAAPAAGSVERAA